MLRLVFSIDGEAQYSRAIGGFASQLDDLRGGFEAMRDEAILPAVRQQFDTQGVHGLGARWQPLNPEYAAWKRAQVGDKPILQFSGRMRREAVAQSSFDVGRRRLTYELPTPYAAHHQRGTGRIPQRKVISLSSTDRRQMDRSMVTWLSEQRKSRGL